MSDAEVQKPSVHHRGDHETKAALIACCGFLLSTFFIVWALLILVRFYIFDNIFYNLFLFCMLTTGIVLNMASINLMLHDMTEADTLLPFVFGLPITFFWTVLCLILPVFKKHFFTQFSSNQLPIALYDTTFYDGLAYEPNTTTIHPFAKRFKSENSFFDNTFLIIIILVLCAISQLILWLYLSSFYFKLRCEEKQMNKADENESKTL